MTGVPILANFRYAVLWGMAVLTIASHLVAVMALAQASAPTKSQPALPAASVGVPEKRICKRIVPTGSIMATRFCLTPSQWRNFNESNQEGALSALRRRGTGMCDTVCS